MAHFCGAFFGALLWRIFVVHFGGAFCAQCCAGQIYVARVSHDMLCRHMRRDVRARRAAQFNIMRLQACAEICQAEPRVDAPWVAGSRARVFRWSAWPMFAALRETFLFCNVFFLFVFLAGSEHV